MLILAEVQKVNKILQDELKKVKKLVTKTAILEEAWMITFVLCGIRCSGLLSKLHTDKETLSALTNALSRILAKDAEDVLILIHVPSHQTFIANRDLLVKRLDRSKAYEHHAYLAVDHTEMNADVQNTAPSSLNRILEEVERSLKWEPRLGVQIICLTCEHSDHASTGSKTGVALAGWLLEYSLIYYFLQSEHVQLQATTGSISSAGKLLLNSFDGWDEAGEMQTNNLAGKELVIFCVDLLIQNESKHAQNVLQFTVPLSALQSTAEAIGVCGGRIEDFKQHLTKLFTDRIQGRNSDQLSIRVDTNQIKMDRVAI